MQTSNVSASQYNKEVEQSLQEADLTDIRVGVSAHSPTRLHPSRRQGATTLVKRFPMGYSASSVDNDFRVPANSVGVALAALNEAFSVEYPTLTDAVENLTSFQECSEASRDEDFVLGYHCDKYTSSTDQVLAVLGRYAVEGSYVRFIGCDDSLFGFRVVDSQLREERGSFTWTLPKLDVGQHSDDHASGETDYRVGWVIDVQSDSHENAARQALAIQRDPESIATVFEVQRRETVPGGAALATVSVDLSAIDGVQTS